MMFADDNYGNVVQVLDPDADHPAGAGLYYHADCHPWTWKWINNINLVKPFKADKIWVVNVGDLKNHELPLDHFLSLGYDFDRWGKRNGVKDYLRHWAARGIGEAVADEVAELMSECGFLSGLRHVEFDPDNFSLINFDEADRIQSRWDNLVKKAEKLVLLHAEALANAQRMYIDVARNRLASRQALVSTNFFARRAEYAFMEDQRIADTYHSLLRGNIMDQPHLNTQSDQWPYSMRNTLPPVSLVNPFVPSRPGNLNNAPAQPGGEMHRSRPARAALLYLCRLLRTRVGITSPVVLQVDPNHGEVIADGSADVKTVFTVDWTKVPSPAPKSGMALIAAGDGTNVTVTIPIHVPTVSKEFKGFVEGDGYVAMEAAHFRSNHSVDGYAFEEIETYGHTLSAGVSIYLGTTLNFLSGKKLAFGIQFDDEPPQRVLPVPDSVQLEHSGSLPVDWPEVVASEIRRVDFKMDLGSQPGAHKVIIQA
ncbi:hypothetical protein EHS25_006962 [Saitozyma podzolica]|uniref:Gylcosyl hydrolase 115 C-terminal domain-containing protein n=1 Tax=Saitozyma podzolica TaxID=1890683 RepID=A0A427XPN8_9TREE|nr:hypothetical protein EHS25_006962 [Saitozyma podzolica]